MIINLVQLMIRDINIMALKFCKQCGEEFKTAFRGSHGSYCSISCKSKYFREKRRYPKIGFFNCFKMPKPWTKESIECTDFEPSKVDVFRCRCQVPAEEIRLIK